jgi:hypothetical protein
LFLAAPYFFERRTTGTRLGSFLFVSDWFAPPVFTLASLVREIGILEL